MVAVFILLYDSPLCGLTLFFFATDLKDFQRLEKSELDLLGKSVEIF